MERLVAVLLLSVVLVGTSSTAAEEDDAGEPIVIYAKDVDEDFLKPLQSAEITEKDFEKAVFSEQEAEKNVEGRAISESLIKNIENKGKKSVPFSRVGYGRSIDTRFQSEPIVVTARTPQRGRSTVQYVEAVRVAEPKRLPSESQARNINNKDAEDNDQETHAFVKDLISDYVAKTRQAKRRLYENKRLKKLRRPLSPVPNNTPVDLSLFDSPQARRFDSLEQITKPMLKPYQSNVRDFLTAEESQKIIQTQKDRDIEQYVSFKPINNVGSEREYDQQPLVVQPKIEITTFRPSSRLEPSQISPQLDEKTKKYNGIIEKMEVRNARIPANSYSIGTDPLREEDDFYTKSRRVLARRKQKQRRNRKKQFNERRRNPDPKTSVTPVYVPQSYRPRSKQPRIRRLNNGKAVGQARSPKIKSLSLSITAEEDTSNTEEEKTVNKVSPYNKFKRKPIFQDQRTHPVEIRYYDALEDEIRQSPFLTESVRLVSSDTFRDDIFNKNKTKPSSEKSKNREKLVRQNSKEKDLPATKPNFRNRQKFRTRKRRPRPSTRPVAPAQVDSYPSYRDAQEWQEYYRELRSKSKMNEAPKNRYQETGLYGESESENPSIRGEYYRNWNSVPRSYDDTDITSQELGETIIDMKDLDKPIYNEDLPQTKPGPAIQVSPRWKNRLASREKMRFREDNIDYDSSMDSQKEGIREDRYRNSDYDSYHQSYEKNIDRPKFRATYRNQDASWRPTVEDDEILLPVRRLPGERLKKLEFSVGIRKTKPGERLNKLREKQMNLLLRKYFDRRRYDQIAHARKPYLSESDYNLLIDYVDDYYQTYDDYPDLYYDYMASLNDDIYSDYRSQSREQIRERQEYEVPKIEKIRNDDRPNIKRRPSSIDSYYNFGKEDAFDLNLRKHSPRLRSNSPRQRDDTFNMRGDSLHADDYPKTKRTSKESPWNYDRMQNFLPPLQVRERLAEGPDRSRGDTRVFRHSEQHLTPGGSREEHDEPVSGDGAWRRQGTVSPPSTHIIDDVSSETDLISGVLARSKIFRSMSTKGGSSPEEHQHDRPQWTARRQTLAYIPRDNRQQFNGSPENWRPLGRQSPETDTYESFIFGSMPFSELRQ